MYQCNQCAATFTSAVGLRYHVMRHSGAYPYYCPYCNKGVAGTKDLKTHLKANHNLGGRAGFVCIHCQFELASIHALKDHLMRCGIPVVDIGGETG